MFDSQSLNYHIVEIDVTGPGAAGDGSSFSVKTVRLNPASSGVVTGKQTYASFLSSLLGEKVDKIMCAGYEFNFVIAAARDRGSGVHLC